jgi:AcrR family transcriptional regulator
VHPSDTDYFHLEYGLLLCQALYVSAKPLAVRRYRGSSAEDRRLHRRERLLDAALRVYGTRGYHSTTVKSVCEAAGLTERYFYESFPNSEALFLTLYRDVCVKALERIRIAGESAGKDPAAQARAMLAAYYANLPDSPACSRVYVVEAFHVSPAAREIWKFWQESLGDLFARAWSRSGARPSPELRRAVAGAIIYIAIDWIEDGFSRPVQSVIETGMQISSVLQTPATSLLQFPRLPETA